MNWEIGIDIYTLMLSRFSHVWLFATLWTAVHQAPVSVEFPGRDTIVDCHFLLQGIFPTQGSNVCLLHWQVDSLPLTHHRSHIYTSVVQLLSHVQLFLTPRTAIPQAFLSFTISWSLLKLMSIESVMPSNYLILCRPFSCPQSFPASGSFPISQLFASGGQSIGASTSATVPSNEYSGLISFRIDWFDLAVQGTLKSLLRHHSWKVSILWCLAFFMV